MEDVISPKTFLAWQTPAYRKLEKTRAWYLLMILVVGIFIVYDLWTGGYVVSVTFLILAAVYYLLESKPVPVIAVAITEMGLRYGTQFYAFSDLRSFWILSTVEPKTLHFYTQKGVAKELSVFLPSDINVAQVRDYLLLKLPEEEGKKESFTEELIRNLGL